VMRVGPARMADEQRPRLRAAGVGVGGVLQHECPGPFPEREPLPPGVEGSARLGIERLQRVEAGVGEAAEAVGADRQRDPGATPGEWRPRRARWPGRSTSRRSRRSPAGRGSPNVCATTEAAVVSDVPRSREMTEAPRFARLPPPVAPPRIRTCPRWSHPASARRLGGARGRGRRRDQRLARGGEREAVRPRETAGGSATGSASGTAIVARTSAATELASPVTEQGERRDAAPPLAQRVGERRNVPPPTALTATEGP